MERFTHLRYEDLETGPLGRATYALRTEEIHEWRRIIEDEGETGVPMSFSLTWFLHALREALKGIPAGGVLTRHELGFREEPREDAVLETEVLIDELYERRGRSQVAFRLRSRSGEGLVAENRMHLIWPRAEGQPGVQSAGERSAAVPPEGEELLTGIISQEQIDRYAELSADYNPLHVDPAAGKASPFGSTIAHGPIPLGYLMRGVERAGGGSWIRGLQVDARFLAPSRPGDRIRAVRVERDRFALVRQDGQVAVAASVERTVGEPQ